MDAIGCRDGRAAPTQRFRVSLTLRIMLFMNDEQLQQVVELLQAANSELTTLGGLIPDDDESDIRQHYNNAAAEFSEALGILTS
jgi:hypothetical protein